MGTGEAVDDPMHAFETVAFVKIYLDEMKGSPVECVQPHQPGKYKIFDIQVLYCVHKRAVI